MGIVGLMGKPWFSQTGKLPPQDKLPGHIAIIMDGNGRWATRRGLPRSAGHAAGSADRGQRLGGVGHRIRTDVDDTIEVEQERIEPIDQRGVDVRMVAHVEMGPSSGSPASDRERSVALTCASASPYSLREGFMTNAMARWSRACGNRCSRHRDSPSP